MFAEWFVAVVGGPGSQPAQVWEPPEPLQTHTFGRSAKMVKPNAVVADLFVVGADQVNIIQVHLPDGSQQFNIAPLTLHCRGVGEALAATAGPVARAAANVCPLAFGTKF